jgi:PhnB protein
MKTLNPYIDFSGKCREALEFYKQCLNGEIVMVQTFGEAPVNAEEKDKSRIMHSEFKAEGVHFMASDGMTGRKAKAGDNISLTIHFTDEKEQEKVFKALAEGGKVTQPLEDTFWGARFGMLVDGYGIHWMLNCMKQ